MSDHDLELILISTKKHWFLDHLKIADGITILYITLIFILGIYMKLTFWQCVIAIVSYALLYLYLITTSKNYSVQGKINISNQDVRILQSNKQLTSYPYQKLTFTTLWYSSGIEWAYKQVKYNQLRIDNKYTYTFLFSNKETVNRLLQFRTDKVEVINLSKP